MQQPVVCINCVWPQSRLSRYLRCGADVKCQECRGACCEVFEMPLTDLRPPNNDAFQWIMLHGQTLRTPRLSLQFECRCTALSESGSCTIYDERPHVCRSMPIGGDECLGYVRDRRTPSQYALIRDTDDPQIIHNRKEV